MFSKVKGLFGGGGKQPRPPLEKPEDLRVGDYVEFGFSDLDALSGRRFRVDQVNAVDYGEGSEASLLLSGESTVIGLSIDRGEGEAGVVVTRLLTRKQVEATFDMEAFGALFDEGFTRDIGVTAMADDLRPWIDGDGYRETADCVKSRFREDGKERWIDFDFYELTGRGDQSLTVELEVYDGETEVYACRWLPMRVIEKLWPAAED